MLSTSSRQPITDDIPPRFREATFEAVQALHPFVAAAIQDALRAHRGLLFQGPTGSGKTYAMVAAARVLMPAFPGTGSGFIDWPEFCEDTRRWYRLRTDDRERFEPMRWIRNVTRPVFVDDVGNITRGQQEHDDALFAEFVANVYRGAGRLLFLTTNLTAADLEKRYGERCWSRLQELCRPVEVLGDDLRRGIA